MNNCPDKPNRSIDRSKPLVYKTHGNLELHQDIFTTYSTYGNWMIGTAKDTGRAMAILLNVPR
ncbi:hypothetical protein DSM106972_009270 [Dulcicalothrix desertica PCC 7102]|uniref:Uncharacterized protein n=1 Tax=Dulcicalothrix desertica PCC 7102 TaxID=232991 RepID=A0A3S1AQS6_9CYAN|nr:hypothetical protein [Dulcicalothrix desertica]RUT08874.1 hypothetical protein DSM106972_009270 [Dulcicalothrix desertica PCC 7102]TWH44110.1 hypothetical protein CAL7102_07888 [Dulcicalothrix desertica PCC 7102]